MPAMMKVPVVRSRPKKDFTEGNPIICLTQRPGASDILFPQNLDHVRRVYSLLLAVPPIHGFTSTTNKGNYLKWVLGPNKV